MRKTYLDIYVLLGMKTFYSVANKIKKKLSKSSEITPYDKNHLLKKLSLN